MAMTKKRISSTNAITLYGVGWYRKLLKLGNPDFANCQPKIRKDIEPDTKPTPHKMNNPRNSLLLVSRFP